MAGSAGTDGADGHAYIVNVATGIEREVT
jgi:hypothetical protein